MTDLNGVPDWRDRIAPAPSGGRNQPAISGAASVAQRGWSVQGVVTSELEAPWYTRAGGTRALLTSALVAYLAALVVSGTLAALMAMVAVALLPLLMMAVLVFVLVGLVPGGRFISGAFMVAGLRGLGSVRRPPGSAVPGRQLTVAGPNGEVEEVLVASSRRLPAGTTVQAFGPRILGRRHAWFVRTQDGSLAPSRGALPAVVVSPLLFVLAALALAGGVIR